MAEAFGTEQLEAQERVWTEIIRRMESLYAQLADSQAELERSALELREAKELADNVIRSMRDALIAVDSAGNIFLVNDAAERLFGFAKRELIGQPLDRLLPGSGHRAGSWKGLCSHTRRHGTVHEVEARWRDRGGTPVPVGLSVSALRDRRGEFMGAVVVVHDLRETKRRIAQARAAASAARARAKELQEANAALKRLQAELIQAAKMSSLGRLAAGVAHELNNPLGGIMLYSDLLLEDMPPDDPRRANVDKIAQQSARCRRIVHSLLDFARPAASVPRPTDVNCVLRDAMGVLQEQEAFHNVQVRWDLAERLPILAADADQLRQAFVNVILNAVEAMQGKGTLSLATFRGPDEESAVVSISDTGPGIPEEHKEHLFEPFFTTKEDGTGLGLPITYGIVTRHNGEIEVTSQTGKGATFRITLRSMKGATGEAGQGQGAGG